MKILFLSNLFPDQAQPNRGSDNAVLLRNLSANHEIRVLCPRPSLVPFGDDFQACEADKKFQPIYHSVGYIPKIGSRFNHRLMASAIGRDLRKIRKTFPFDVVLTSWIYPDACATALVAKEMKFPFVAIAQGSDVHQYLAMPRRRKIIRELLPDAAAVITRSADLARLLAEVGLEEKKLKVIYNGIDQTIFRRKPEEGEIIRESLKLLPHCPVLLFVGNFLPIKNISLLIKAHAALCEGHPKRRPYLILLGSGPLEGEIKAEAKDLGFSDYVIFAGRKPPGEVARYMQAADALCLSSDNEGFPNVILEAWACGLPVVSTAVGGISELLREDYLGRLTEKGNVMALLDALNSVLGKKAESERIAEYGAQFSWERTAKAYEEVLLLAKDK